MQNPSLSDEITEYNPIHWDRFISLIAVCAITFLTLQSFGFEENTFGFRAGIFIFILSFSAIFLSLGFVIVGYVLAHLTVKYPNSIFEREYRRATYILGGLSWFVVSIFILYPFLSEYVLFSIYGDIDSTVSGVAVPGSYPFVDFNSFLVDSTTLLIIFLTAILAVVVTNPSYRTGPTGSSQTSGQIDSEATSTNKFTRTEQTTSTPHEQIDTDSINRNLEKTLKKLEQADQDRETSEYDRALARCREAIDIAEEVHANACEDAPSRVSDAEAAVDDATELRESIKTERDAYERATDALASAEDALDTAATALDSGAAREALDHLNTAWDALDRATEPVESQAFPDLTDRLAALEERHERLRQHATDARTRVPTTIPTTPRYSLIYDDIQKGEAIGSGGNADVFHATAVTGDGTVELALKEPQMSGTLHTETVERMMQEAETWQQLDDHDYIVSVVDYGSEPLPWIAMEYMDGGHLGERIAEMERRQKLWTALAVTEGVDHAHMHGVIHRDLKPENILFREVDDAWDVPKVADWALEAPARTLQKP